MDKRLITIEDVIRALEELKLIHTPQTPITVEDERSRNQYMIREIYFDPNTKKVVIR